MRRISFLAIWFLWVSAMAGTTVIPGATTKLIQGGTTKLIASGGAGGGTVQWVTSFNTATGTRTDGPYVLGCHFTVGGSPITVQSLSRWIRSGDSQVHRVGIWDAAPTSPTLLAFVTITTSGATANAYKEVTLSSPITLSASTSYVLASEEFGSGDAWFDTHVGTLTGVATVDFDVYSDSTTAPFEAVSVFNNAGTPGQIFSAPSFGY